MALPEGMHVQDVKFLGVVASYNDAKKFGMVASEEAQAMWGQEIYAYKDVLGACNAQVGDTIRFGIHVNPRGQPQVSLPIFKIGDDGLPIDQPPDLNIVNCEEYAATDPSFLDSLKAEIEGRSQMQNTKRSRKGEKGGGKGGEKGGDEWGAKRMRTDAKGYSKGGDGGWGDSGKGKGAPAWGGWGEEPAWGKDGGKASGGKSWGKGKAKGGGESWGPQEVTLFIGGLPPDVQRREVLHIFRQYAGFTSLRMTPRADHAIAFATFQTMEQAKFVTEALSGYVFDEEAPPEYQGALSVTFAKEKTKGAGKGY